MMFGLRKLERCELESPFPKLDIFRPQEIRKQKGCRISFNNSKRIQEIVAAFLSGTILLSSIIWLLHLNYHNHEHNIHISKNDSFKKSVKNPVIVWYTTNVWWIPLNRNISCYNKSRTYVCDVFRRQTQPDDPEAYLFYGADMDRFPLPRDPKTIWGLLQDESPKTRLMFVLEKALNLFNLSSTFSRHSDVPLPLMAMRGIESVTSTLYFVETVKKNTFLAEIAPVIFLQSNCIASSGRDQFVTELMKYIQVDSYGICLHNKDLPLHRMYLNFKTYIDHLYGQELLIFMARYKFIIAIENGICSDYMTEKLWRAIEIGVVPIYYGSPLVRDWLPNNKSAILVEDFATPELLSEHLHYLLQNDTAYEEYLKHKTLGAITNQKLIDEITTRPYQTSLREVVKQFECFVCQKLHDTNKNPINIVTKKDYDCMLPTSEITLSVYNENSKLWLEVIYNTSMDNVQRKIDNLYEEILGPDKTPRCSNTSWDW